MSGLQFMNQDGEWENFPTDSELAEKAKDLARGSANFGDLFMALGDRIIDLTSEVGQLQHALGNKET